MFTKLPMRSRFALPALALGLLLACGQAGATPPPPVVTKIPDLDYVKRTFFLISDRPIHLKPGSLQVFKDNGFDPPTFVDGLARLDPTAPMDSLSNPERGGRFAPLERGTDYDEMRPWIVDCVSCDLEIPVIRLAAPLYPSDVLAVAYIDASNGIEVRVGNTAFEADPVLGKPEGRVLLKSIHPQSFDFISDPATGLINPSTPWYPAHFYELRNFYDLKMANIPLERMQLKVRAINPGGAADPDAVDKRPFIQILGLDQQSDGYASDHFVPDGKVDTQYINPFTGLMFFPDLHPFAPDTTNPTGVCEPGAGFGSFNCLDNYARNILRYEPPNFLTQANLYVYYVKDPNPFTDSRYYIEMTILPPDEPGGTLQQNAPNPFNPGTSIRFELFQSDRARVSIFDVKGRLVTQLLDAVLPRGRHEVAWNGNDAQGARVASGIYFCRLETGGQTHSNRMVLSR